MFNPKRYLQNTDTVRLLQKGRGSQQWILARSLCFYRCFDLRTIPARERENALRLKIEQWNPLVNADSYRVWKNDRVQVWLWDKDKQIAELAKQNLKTAQCIPETLLHPHQGSGLHYLSLEQGYEAQIWEKKVLIISHWWANEPSEIQWQRFQRNHRLTISAIPITSTKIQWLAKVWGRNKAPLQHHKLFKEDLWLGISLSILVAFFVWNGLSISKWQQALNELAIQKQVLNTKIEPILKHRSAALEQQQIIQTLHDLKPYPNPLELLLTIANKLPQGSHLIGFTYQPGQLTFTIFARKIDPRYYVSTFEKSPLFKDVTTENGANPLQLVLKMQILKTADY